MSMDHNNMNDSSKTLKSVAARRGSESTGTAGYAFEVGKKYKTSDGFVVEFVRHKKHDGMYHVFRHGKDMDYKPYYTDEYGFTKDGMRVYPNG